MTIAVTEEIFNRIRELFSKIEKEEDIQRVIEYTRQTVNGIGCQIVSKYLEEKDREIFEERDRERYRDKGKRHRHIQTLMGYVEYDRHRYVDRSEDAEKKLVYLLDEEMGLLSHETVCDELGREMINGACVDSYRIASKRLREISGMSLAHQQVWHYVQRAGNMALNNVSKMQKLEKSGESRGEISSKLLYFENDGIWLSLQGQSRKENNGLRSKEMKVGVAYDGVRYHISKTGKKRRILDEKVAIATFDGAKEFERKKRAVVADHYDMTAVDLIIKNGDGAGWIQKKEPEIETILVLDEFHRNKKLRECVDEADAIKAIQSLLYANETDAALDTIESMILSLGDESDSRDKKEKLTELYNFYADNRTALASPYARGIEIPKTREPGVIHHARLGSMESNIYTIIGKRMKDNRCSWSIKGANNLAYLLCLYHTDRLDEVFKTVPDPTPFEEDIFDKAPLSVKQATATIGKGYEYPYTASIDPRETWLKDIALFNSMI